MAKALIGTIDCSGPKGNIFYITGMAAKAMMANGEGEKAQEMRNRVRNSKSYEDAKSVIAEYVEVIYED